MECPSSESPCESGYCSNNGNNSKVAGKTATADGKTCAKCGGNIPISIKTLGGSDLCESCFRSNIYGKFRLAVTSHAMITPSDNVLIAFSGGSSSRVALHFVHELQQRKQENFDASKDRALRVFGASAVFIDDRIVHPNFNSQYDDAIEGMRSIVSNLSPPTFNFIVTPIESIYSSDSPDEKQKFMSLISAVADETGKEDLLQHLLMLALQNVAIENGYNKIILGSSTSRIARHVLQSTVKGKGYSLSSEIHHVNAMWEVPVTLPLRDCTSVELNSICIIDGYYLFAFFPPYLNDGSPMTWQGSLKTVEFPVQPSLSINNLVSSFVSSLQVDNPSRESTIVRTAGKLTPFSFNAINECDFGSTPLSTIRRVKKNSINAKQYIKAELFCCVCNCPMKSDEAVEIVSFKGKCCSSCRFQILPKDPSKFEHFQSLLPQQSRMCLSNLREQIDEFLIYESEEET